MDQLNVSPDEQIRRLRKKCNEQLIENESLEQRLYSFQHLLEESEYLAKKDNTQPEDVNNIDKLKFVNIEIPVTAPY